MARWAILELLSVLPISEKIPLVMSMRGSTQASLACQACLSIWFQRSLLLQRDFYLEALDWALSLNGPSCPALVPLVMLALSLALELEAE